MSTLMETAEGLLSLAHEEAERGFAENDPRKVRDAAEKAWLASNLAVDHAAQVHQEVIEPGAAAHIDRHDFLEKKLGRNDLSDTLAIFAKRLHGDCFYFGACPTKDGMEVRFAEVRQFLEHLKQA